jgi:hydroxyacylglutathione hydrolase
MLSIYPISAFQDNYIWCVVSDHTGKTLVIDPGEAAPVERFLAEHNLDLDTIFVTHHHPDHVGGVKALAEKHAPRAIYGPAQSPFKGITTPLKEGDEVPWNGMTFKVFQVPGHTLDHIAYYTTSEMIAGAPALFCGDTLFVSGCGRLFEGTPSQMRISLEKLRALAQEARVYCAHEYTLANLRFARDLLPEDTGLRQLEIECKAKRDEGEPTVPTTLATETACNPFLRWDEPSVVDSVEKRAIDVDPNLSGNDRIFAMIRKAKDEF